MRPLTVVHEIFLNSPAHCLVSVKCQAPLIRLSHASWESQIPVVKLPECHVAQRLLHFIEISLVSIALTIRSRCIPLKLCKYLA